jgi:glutaconate CoA-transferase subunit B
MPQEKRTFVAKLDFVSALGFGKGPGDRERLGVPGGGPRRVFTDLAVWGFEETTKTLTIETVHPWVDRQTLVDSVAFAADFPAAPVTTELSLIRHQIDPDRLFLGAKIA